MKKKFKENNPVEHKMRQCAENLVKRLYKNIDKPANKSYKEKGIKSKIGENSSEVYQYLYDNHYADFKYYIDKQEIPSIDRIDSNKHYEQGNIRIISFAENSRLGREASKKVCSIPIKITYKESGNTNVYKSIVDAGRNSEFTRDILQNILYGRVKKDHGIFVEIISEDEYMKLIKITQDGCRPCTLVSNYLNDNAIDYDEVNISQDKTAIEKFNIMGTPVTILTDDHGVEYARVVGYDPDGLDEIITQLNQ